MEELSTSTKFGANFWIIVTALLGIGLGSFGTWMFVNRYVKIPSPVELAFPKHRVVAQTKTVSVDPNAGYAVISEFGVRFKTSDTLAGLTHLYKDASGLPTVYFSTVALTNGDAQCGADKTTTGALSQYKAGDKTSFGTPIENVPSAVKVGSNYYQFVSAQSLCSDKTDLSKQQSDVMNALKTATVTLEAAK